jgi:hypothetical protein
MQTSSHVKEIRQCNCGMCRLIRARGESFSKWGKVRSEYKLMLRNIVKGDDPENYNKQQATRDYDA